MPDGTSFEWEYGFYQLGLPGVGLNMDLPPQDSPWLVANTSSPFSKPNVARRAVRCCLFVEPFYCCSLKHLMRIQNTSNVGRHCLPLSL
jgi:hypothetical protein